MTEEVNVKKRVVVKLGTTTLTQPGGGLDLRFFDRISRVLTDLKNAGHEIILVSSGAIAVGRRRLYGYKNKKLYLSEKQAMAAIGQGILMHIYEKSFSEYNQVVAQVLLTREDLADRKRFINARNTLTELLKMGVVPIINENDTVSNEEVRFGDNDTLAALVGVLVDADHVILLSDVDGLYDKNPIEHPDAKKIDRVDAITDEIRSMAGGTGSNVGTGGMVTKIRAAEIATQAGVHLSIIEGKNPDQLYDMMQGESVGTLFVSHQDHLKSRTSWLVFGSKAKGKLVVDEGAAKALLFKGKSLLPSGILSCDGGFHAGDVVEIENEKGEIIGRGICHFNEHDVRTLRGHHSDDIPTLVEDPAFDVIVHRDNMVLREVEEDEEH